jgi:addiction module HigA family antidote
MGVTAYRLAKETSVPQTRISQIIHGKRGLSAETALRLAKFFGTSAEFWLGLQNDYDLEESKRSFDKELIKIRTYSELKELTT